MQPLFDGGRHERFGRVEAQEFLGGRKFTGAGLLGLLLGSAGLGVVVLRNVLERRGELGLLQAVGFPRRSIRLRSRFRRRRPDPGSTK